MEARRSSRRPLQRSRTKIRGPGSGQRQQRWINMFWGRMKGPADRLHAGPEGEEGMKDESCLFSTWVDGGAITWNVAHWGLVGQVQARENRS